MFVRADLYEADDELVIEAELPGLAPEEIELMVSTDRVCIVGNPNRSRVQCRAPTRRMHRRERRIGRFMREIPLPLPVLRDSAEATLSDGLLTVRLVIRKAPAPPSRLRVCRRTEVVLEGDPDQAAIGG